MTDFPSSPETASAKIEKHLWDAIDLMAATLEKPDPRVWAMLDIYRPSDLAQRPDVDLMQRVWANLYYNEEDAGNTFQQTLNEVVDWLTERNALPKVADTSTDRPAPYVDPDLDRAANRRYWADRESGSRMPKVRTSHHRNKEEADRLQKLVNERLNPESPLSSPVRPDTRPLRGG